MLIQGKSAFHCAYVASTLRLAPTFRLADVHESPLYQGAYFSPPAKQIRSVLAVPLLNNAGNVVAALQVSRCDADSDGEGLSSYFTADDAHVLESAATFTQMVRASSL